MFANVFEWLCFQGFLSLLDSLMYANLHAVAAVAITEHPENVSAHVGESALMSCVYEGTDVYPSWSIDNVLYSSLELPPYYVNIYGEGLFIPYLDVFMNNTKFVCVFGSKISSKPGYLTVLEQSMKMSLFCSVGFIYCHFW